jgi:hypothetical protein
LDTVSNDTSPAAAVACSTVLLIARAANIVTLCGCRLAQHASHLRAPKVLPTRVQQGNRRTRVWGRRPALDLGLSARIKAGSLAMKLLQLEGDGSWGRRGGATSMTATRSP